MNTFPMPMGCDPENNKEEITRNQLKTYIQDTIEEEQHLTWEAVDKILEEMSTQPKVKAQSLTNKDIDELLEFGEHIRKRQPGMSISDALEMMRELKDAGLYEEWLENAREDEKTDSSTNYIPHDPEQEVGTPTESMNYKEWSEQPRTNEQIAADKLHGIDLTRYE